ncbi:MAG: V-type ATP synthase subunit D [Spirochaetaceae bacterium]|nr:MAG: V-type ATP synthase subunit D [Spirochaetaceae bacterium]
MPNVAPTKTNLLRIRHELEFARLGHELLDQKRNILVLELLNLVDQTVDFQDRVVKALEEAYRTLEQAVLRMGKLRVSSLASAVNIRAEIELKTRRVMGVRLPVVQTSFSEHPPYYSPLGTSFWIDNSLEEFKQALQLMGRLAELKISIIRLAAEVRKTIRKVNALEKIAIPDLEQTVGFIQNRLEENERDMFVLMKMVKRRLEAKEGAERGT